MSKTIYICYEDYTPETDDPVCNNIVLKKAFTNSVDAENYCAEQEKETGNDYYFQELELEVSDDSTRCN